MRVLLVEYDAMIAQGLQVALRQAGFTVDWTGDGMSAASALRSTTFDLVLLDLGLPGRDGLEVLQELRRRADAHPVWLQRQKPAAFAPCAIGRDQVFR